jgi:DNA-binding MarR family transcriptional regulator
MSKSGEMQVQSGFIGAGSGGKPAGEDFDPVLKAIRRIIHAVDSRSKKVARATGLTIPQIVVLRAIRDLGEVPTNRLSAHADLTAATVITILDKLDEKGLIARRRSTEDRRIVYTRLTPRGAEVVSAAPPLLNDAFVEAFARMPDIRRRRLIKALGEVATLFDIADRARGSGAIVGGPAE